MLEDSETVVYDTYSNRMKFRALGWRSSPIFYRIAPFCKPTNLLRNSPTPTSISILRYY